MRRESGREPGGRHKPLREPLASVPEIQLTQRSTPPIKDGLAGLRLGSCLWPSRAYIANYVFMHSAGE